MTDIFQLYQKLAHHFGPMPAWWPIFGSDTPFEMLLGAVLVQQTRWETVEQAVLRLHAAGLLAPHALAQADADTLADLLRPTAFYRQKAAGLIAICAYLGTHYSGSTAALLAQPTAPLRRELLALPRIGNETADVILLYAGHHTVFVVDDYTRRVFGRVAPQATTPRPSGFTWERARYEVVRAHIEQELEHAHQHAAGQPALPDLTRLYADYHALLNEECVRYCVARRPRCDGPPARRVYSVQEGRDSYLHRHDGCPLREVCAFYRASREQGAQEA
jgi:endonuclease-3 related protein